MSKTLKAAVKAEMIPRRINIRILLCMFAAMPVSFILSGANMLDYEGFDASSAALAILIFFIALIFEAYLCVSLFKDCHKSESADVTLSLPVSSEERFTAKGIIYTLCITLPFLAVSVIILITAFLVCIYNDWGTNDIYMPWLSMMFEGLVMIICVMGVSFLCSSLCSSSAGALATSIFGVLALTLLPLELYSAALSCAHIDAQEHLPCFLGCFGFDGIELLITEGADRPGYYISGLVNILVSLLLMSGAYRIYKKRDRKTITENHFSKPFMLVFLILCTFAGSETMLLLGGFIGFLAVFIAGISVYLLILTKKGFGVKKACKWLISFTVLCAGFLVMNIALINTEGFHMSKLPQGADDSKTYAFEVKTNHYKNMEELETEYYYNKNATPSQLEKAHSILKSFEEKAVKKQSAADFILKGLNTANERSGMIIYATTYTDADQIVGSMTRSIYVINESDYDKLIKALYDSN